MGGIVSTDHSGQELKNESCLEGYDEQSNVLFNNWYYHLTYHRNISKRKAEKLLKVNKIPGTFLIWQSSKESSETIKNDKNSTTFPEHNLSIQDGDNVKHYRIRRLDEGGFFITRRAVFNTLKELVDYYRKDSDGLCCMLSVACSQLDVDLLLDDKIDLLLEGEIDDRIRELPFDSVTLKGRLGSGYFTTVWKGHYRNCPVAVKGIQKTLVNSDLGKEVTSSKMDRNLLFKMLNIYTSELHHVNILKIYGCAVGGTKNKVSPFIITEFASQGDLSDYLRWGEGRSLSVHQLVDISIQIASAMSYLEDLNLTHSNLSLSYVLMGDNNTCKLAAFSFPWLKAIYYDSTLQEYMSNFSFQISAPEFMLSQYQEFNIKSDVWSFGILMLQLFSCGAALYMGRNESEIISYLDSGSRPPCPRDTPQELYSIMMDCWKWDPYQRPSFKQLRDCLQTYIATAEGLEDIFPYKDTSFEPLLR